MQYIYNVPVGDNKDLKELTDGMTRINEAQVWFAAYLYYMDKVDVLEDNLTKNYPNMGLKPDGEPIDSMAGFIRYELIEAKHTLCQLYREMVKMPEFAEDCGVICKPIWYMDDYLPEYEANHI